MPDWMALAPEAGGRHRLPDSLQELRGGPFVRYSIGWSRIDAVMEYRRATGQYGWPDA